MGCAHSYDIAPRWGYKGVAPMGLYFCTSILLLLAL